MSEQWISVDDRLPENIYHDHSANVLIAVQYATDLDEEEPTICCGYLIEGKWWSYAEHHCNEIGDKWRGDKVTHWMPLPEPPKNQIGG